MTLIFSSVHLAVLGNFQDPIPVPDLELWTRELEGDMAVARWHSPFPWRCRVGAWLRSQGGEGDARSLISEGWSGPAPSKHMGGKGI